MSYADRMEGKEFFPPKSAFQPLMFSSIRVLFPVCILTWRVKNCVSRQGKGMNKKMEVPT